MSSPLIHRALLLAGIALGSAACSAARTEATPDQAACRATEALAEGPAPLPNADMLARLNRTEEAVVPVPREAFLRWFLAVPLERLLPGTAEIPAVTGTRPLSDTPFPEPGARRLVCLADGSTAVEQVLEHVPGERFRYIVWAYTTPAAAPIAYGVGEFHFRDAPGGTAIHWRYAFAIRQDRFPGALGALGRGLFRLAFLEGPYARFMQSGMAAIRAEAMAAHRATTVGR